MKSINKAVLLTVIIFGVYAFCANQFPSGYADSDELIVASALLSNAHPPGYSLFICITHIFQTIGRIGGLNTAHASNLFASFCHALTIGCLYLFFKEMYPKSKNDFPIIIGVLLLAFSGYFWLYSEILEVMSLGSLCVSIVLLCSIKWITTKKNRFVILTAIVTGLGIAHLQTLILLVPGLVVTLIQYRPKSQSVIKLMMQAVGITIISFVIGSMPLIALNNHHQTYTWDFAPTLKGWWNMITRDDYKGFFPDKNYQSNSAYIFTNFQIIAPVISYFKTIWNNFGGPISFISIIGAIYLWKSKSYRGCIVHFVFLGIALAMYTTYIPSSDILSNRMMLGISQRQYIPGFVLFDVLLGIGCIELYTTCTKIITSKNNRYILLSVACLTVTSFVYSNISMGYQRHNNSVATYANTILSHVDHNAVIVCSSDLSCFSLLYQSLIEHTRPDVVVLFQNNKARKYLLDKHPEYIGYQFSSNPYFFTQEIIWNVQQRPTYIVNLDKYYEEFIGLDANPFYTIPQTFMYQVKTTSSANNTAFNATAQTIATSFAQNTVDSRDYIGQGNRDYMYEICKNAAQRFIKLDNQREAIDAIDCALSFSKNAELVRWRTYLDQFIVHSKYPRLNSEQSDTYSQLSTKSVLENQIVQAESYARKALYLNPTKAQKIDALISLYDKYGYPWLSSEMNRYKAEVLTLRP